MKSSPRGEVFRTNLFLYKTFAECDEAHQRSVYHHSTKLRSYQTARVNVGNNHSFVGVKLQNSTLMKRFWVLKCKRLKGNLFFFCWFVGTEMKQFHFLKKIRRQGLQAAVKPPSIQLFYTTQTRAERFFLPRFSCILQSDWTWSFNHSHQSYVLRIRLHLFQTASLVTSSPKHAAAPTMA